MEENMTNIWEILLDSRVSYDEEETENEVIIRSWIFTEEAKMRDFLDKLIESERQNLKNQEHPNNVNFTEFRFGGNQMSWYGELRNRKSWVRSKTIYAYRKEANPLFITEKICGAFIEIL